MDYQTNRPTIKKPLPNKQKQPIATSFANIIMIFSLILTLVIQKHDYSIQHKINRKNTFTPNRHQNRYLNL